MPVAPTSNDLLDPALGIITFFKARSALVVAAVKALDGMAVPLADLKSRPGATTGAAAQRHVRLLVDLVRSAAIDGDNLLVARSGRVHEPFVVCAVSRQARGPVDVRTIEIERQALALTDERGAGSTYALDRLAAALHASATGRAVDVTAAIDAMTAQVRSATSRLSLVKARLDLQESFLASARETKSDLRAESHLTTASARDVALEAKRLLQARSVNIANGSPATIPDHVERRVNAYLPDPKSLLPNARSD